MTRQPGIWLLRPNFDCLAVFRWLGNWAILVERPARRYIGMVSGWHARVVLTRVRSLRRRDPVQYNLRESRGHSVLHLIRSSRSRRAFVWSCVPYLLLSVFADFLHVHPLPSPGSAAVGIAQPAVSVPAQPPHRIPDWSCAICQWQRVGPGPQAATVAFAIVSAPALVLPVTAAFPKSPVPHPSAFRGPPLQSFS